MKKIFQYIALSAALCGMASCDAWLDVNHSQDGVTTVTVDQMLPVATFYASQINYDIAEYGVYLSQCLTTGGKSQTGSYPYSQGWEFLSVNRHPMWRRYFYDLGTNIQMMNVLAEEKGIKNAQLIGRTIMLQAGIFTTDCFGEMPMLTSFAAIGEQAATSPKYNSQEEIYEYLFKEADELCNLFKDEAWTNATNNLPITRRMDRIYAGDLKKWEAYAKAIRARLWLRKLPNWDNTPANCQKIIDMVDDILASGNWEEPRYQYDGGKNEQNCPWGPSAMKINSWESRDNRLSSSIPAAFMANLLGFYPDYFPKRGYSLDPRAEKMMNPREGDKAGSALLRYLESNIGMDNSMKITYYPDLLASTSMSNPYTQDNGYVCLFTTEELYFIKAEAQYWNGDAAGAYNTVKEAVEMNMRRFGVDMAPSQDYVKDQRDGFWAMRLPGPTITLDQLMQQKYIAMYLQTEQWNDMRRYNYSSKTNGIQYDGVYVYTIMHALNKTSADATKKTYKEGAWTAEYSLRRPYNLYEPYWCTDDCFSTTADYSPNAWVNRLNPDTETETKYNREELQRIGAMNGTQVDYRWLKKRLIWAKNESGAGKMTCQDPSAWE